MGHDKSRDIGKWLPYLAAAPALGAIGVSVYALALGSWSVFAVALLVAGAAFAGGALLGFLFGIPRLLATEGTAAGQAFDDGVATQSDRHRPVYRTNTNLEQISDWLTKILVGVGLVQLGEITSGTRTLVDFLSPALGNNASSPGFALAVLFLYTISGFLIVYLMTRVYLGRVFAQADELMEYVDEKINEVKEAQQAQEDRDVAALAGLNRQLEPESSGTAITPGELAELARAASPLVRAQMFQRAREKRKRGSGDDIARAGQIFQALAQADKEDVFHRNYAQLGYALRDQPEPDIPGAEAALTKAIRIRDRKGEKGWRLYEFVRALCRIQQGPGGTDPSPAEVRDPILSDLRAAATIGHLRKAILADPATRSWLGRNGVKKADL
jgi:hypothetical protein